jgi:hypothetical protein
MSNNREWGLLWAAIFLTWMLTQASLRSSLRELLRTIWSGLVVTSPGPSRHCGSAVKLPNENLVEASVSVTDEKLAYVDLNRVHKMLLDQVEPGDEEAVATLDHPGVVYPRGQRVQRRLFKQAKRIYIARGFAMALDILRDPQQAGAIASTIERLSSDDKA